MAETSGCPKCLADLVPEDHGNHIYYWCPECKMFRRQSPKDRSQDEDSQ